MHLRRFQKSTSCDAEYHQAEIAATVTQVEYARLPMFKRADFLLLGIALVLTLFGLAMISSVSVFESYQLTQRLVDQGLRADTSNAFYLWRSFLHVLVGLTGMALASLTPYRLWERYARTLFIISLLLLIALYIPGLSNSYGTARSWLHIGPVSFQPSEFFKITVVFYLAVWLQKREALISTFKEGFVPFVVLLCISTFLVALQPDLGSFLIFSSIGIVMFFIAGGNIVHLFLGGAAAGLLGLPIILNEEYVRNRFLAFLSPNDPSIAEGIGFQIKQALIAIGSGGIFGVGYGKSIQKFGYLPEVQSDTIFAAMGEELGFLRLLIVLGLYALFIYRGYTIARNAPDRFGFMVATGLTTWIATQTILNIAVNLALFPLTGLTLPFISYGGSSLISTLFAVGVLLNISMASTQMEASMRRTDRSSKTHSLKRYVHG
jgi:cell division protein FtsW